MAPTHAAEPGPPTWRERERHPRILLVDDEPDILLALQGALEGHLGGPVQVETASTGMEARERLDGEREYDMVITDERMPGLRGVELLEWLRLTHPRTLRVLMTAYRDPRVAPEVVNRAAAHLFLYKPFELAETLPALRRAVDEKLRRDAQERSLERALRTLRHLAREALGPPT